MRTWKPNVTNQCNWQVQKSGMDENLAEQNGGTGRGSMSDAGHGIEKARFHVTYFFWLVVEQSNKLLNGFQLLEP
jgi:hypothetical protein